MSKSAVCKLTEASRRRWAKAFTVPLNSKLLAHLRSVEGLWRGRLDPELNIKNEKTGDSAAWKILIIGGKCVPYVCVPYIYIFVYLKVDLHICSFVRIIFLIIKSHQYLVITIQTGEGQEDQALVPSLPLGPSAWEILIRSPHSLVSGRSVLHPESETVGLIPPLRLLPQLSGFPTASLH